MGPVWSVRGALARAARAAVAEVRGRVPLGRWERAGLDEAALAAIAAAPKAMTVTGERGRR